MNHTHRFKLVYESWDPERHIRSSKCECGILARAILDHNGPDERFMFEEVEYRNLEEAEEARLGKGGRDPRDS